MPSPPRLPWCLGLLALLINAGWAANVEIATTPIDTALAALSPEQLIDRLQKEGQREVDDSTPTQRASHTETPAYEHAFLPVQGLGEGEENITPQPRSAVMTELVRRGVAAMQALLEHLADARETHIRRMGAVMLNGPFGEARFDYRDPGQPPKAHPILYLTERQLAGGEVSIVRVGDLCYGVIGQIVNRRFGAGGGPWQLEIREIHQSFWPNWFQKPFSLAEAVRADWDKLTPAEHEQSLLTDARRRDERGLETSHTWDAIRRSLFYYPATGQKFAEAQLRLKPVDCNTVGRPLTTREVDFGDQQRFLVALRPVHWDGLETELLELFHTVIAETPTNPSAKYTRDSLAFECARRIAGHGHDEELKAFIVERLAANEKTLTAKVTDMRYALTQTDQSYREFLGTLR